MKNIINGYKGVMDLDLTYVDNQFHKFLIQQHYKDIELYKIEQSKLKDELKYDNGVGLAIRKMENENKIISKRFKLCSKK